jgi:hypothetical protein
MIISINFMHQEANYFDLINVGTNHLAPTPPSQCSQYPAYHYGSYFTIGEVCL